MLKNDLHWRIFGAKYSHGIHKYQHSSAGRGSIRQAALMVCLTSLSVHCGPLGLRKAGERGATSIGVEHFLLGLVLEDQGTLGENLFSALQGQVGTPVNEIPSHVPFFSHEAAKNLLTRIEASFIAAKPVGLMTEIPLSPALERTFAAAKKIQVRFRSAHIEPLHLLAAILDDAPSRCAKLLQQNGITKEQVLGQLMGTAAS